MKLPQEIPKDIDYTWYVNETYDILRDLGVDISNTIQHNHTSSEKHYGNRYRTPQNENGPRHHR